MTETLAGLREAIDAIDTTILTALGERIALARAVARLKSEQGVPIVDPEREAAVVERAGAFARANGMNEPEVRSLYWRLLALSRREQLDQSRGSISTAGDPPPLPAD